MAFLLPPGIKGLRIKVVNSPGLKKGKQSLKQQPEVFYKKDVLKNFAKITGKSSVTESLFLIQLQDEACDFIKKETLARVFCCEFCDFLETRF